MATVDRIRRLFTLVGHLQSGRVLDTNELAGRRGVSQRTLFRDLAALRSSGFSVCYDDRTRGHFIVAPNVSLPRDITPEELLALAALDENVQSGDLQIPYLQQASTAITKLLQRADGSLAATVARSIKSIVIRSHPTKDSGAADVQFAQVRQAISKQVKVRLTYRVPNSIESDSASGWPQTTASTASRFSSAIRPARGQGSVTSSRVGIPSSTPASGTGEPAVVGVVAAVWR